MHGFPDNLGIYDALAPLLAQSGRRVVAFDFLGYGDSDKPADYRYTPTTPPDLAAAFLGDPTQFRWLLQFQARQFQRDAPPELRERAQVALVPVIQRQFAATPNAGPAFMSLTRDLRASVEANTRRAPALSTFRRPVRLIWGAGHPYLNRGVAEHLRDLFPAAELTLLPFGHWPQIDGPERVAEVLNSPPSAD
jgi:pimeloyl-ACP methyl ester carboxylesterase